MTHPFGNLGPIIIAALGEVSVISVSRRAVGSYVNGSWVRGAPTVTNYDAVVQPSSPRELQQLQENERTTEAITLYTLTPLQTSDVSSSVESDIVTWAGRTWRVRLVEDWLVQAQYARAIAIREGV